MSTDLTQIHDHPAVLLNKQAESETGSAQHGLMLAAGRLRAHEQEHNGTFAFLDGDALTAVREAYHRSEDVSEREAGLSDLRDAVRDLLGLADD